MRPQTELTERQKRKRRKAIFRQSLLALAALLLVAGAILLISALIRGAKCKKILYKWIYLLLFPAVE